MGERMYGLKTIPNNNKLKMKFNQKLKIDLSKDFILINPNEIKEFTSDKLDLIKLINDSNSLINNFFPNSKIYLEYKEDPEYEELNAIFAYIIMKNNDHEENRQVYNDFLKEFVKLKELFSNVYFSYYVDIKYNEEYLKSKQHDSG